MERPAVTALARTCHQQYGRMEMTGRLIPWLAVLIALSAALPAVRTIKDDAVNSLQRTEREVDQGVRGYFAREIRKYAF